VKKQRVKEERLRQPDLFGEAAQLPEESRQTSPHAQPTPRPRRERIVNPPPALLNVREAAARLGLSKSTLDKMRCAGKGPRYIKSTDRAVRYDPEDLDAWIAARKKH
jgi:predicted DNA-binding transcriptional regulator AlpA